jgi:hypothetical protein
MPRRITLLALLLTFALAGRDTSNDPDAFGVNFKNDLGKPVLIELCHSDHSAKCDDPYYKNLANENTSYPENISPDVRTEWAVADTHGRLLRCMVLYWNHAPGHSPTVRLSTAPRWTNPCPQGPY